MLTFMQDVPERAIAEAAEFARSCFDADGDDRLLRISHRPLEVFAATDATTEAFAPNNLVSVGLCFAVLHDKTVVGFVTVDGNAEEPLAVSMEFIERGSATLAALELADASAKREGLREVRVIQLPVVDAAFFWVTGPEPEFVDQIENRTYDERAFVKTMRDRLEVKKAPPATFDPSPSQPTRRTL